ncbi:hypothetical protein MNEG_6316 [Monoraphidium neglectum]|uniref:Uncharacterized protein n=1 Tax=Monoraphidium neglectum TaxID=145388 RepID=A0A0D2MEV8_9CHLO|nr:hypothetical protein MNEG_6316 [Monoraphidium neglectum]KIZ01650.1 hypothetical protein MNEG_6316 [Monoraphidium neglectum]|eukprot:XP_013900669.1 hypothetical protein MNEG_6316 [Monoraphidium neglectum]
MPNAPARPPSPCRIGAALAPRRLSILALGPLRLSVVPVAVWRALPFAETAKYTVLDADEATRYSSRRPWRSPLPAGVEACFRVAGMGRCGEGGGAWRAAVDQKLGSCTAIGATWRLTDEQG